MKSLLVLFMLGQQAFADDLPRLIREVSEGVTPSVTCDAETCRDVVAAVCRPANPQTQLNSITADVNRRFPRPRQNASLTVQRTSAMPRFAAAEAAVFQRSPASRSELSALVEESRVNMVAMVEANTYIPADKKLLMIQKLRDVKVFFTAAEFIADKAAMRMRTNPQRGLEWSTNRAFEEYTDKCQDHGLEVNAVNVGNIGICPGLIASLVDRTTSKTELLNAISFTLGHEMSHSIGPQDFPEVYTRLGECYNTLSGNPQFWNGDGSGSSEGKGRASRQVKQAASSGKPTGPAPAAPANGGEEGPSGPDPMAEETTADWWGGQILAGRIRAQNLQGNEVIRTVGNATDGLCDSDEGGGYTSGNNRIGLSILRAPGMRESVGCQVPEAESRSCGLNGVQN